MWHSHEDEDEMFQVFKGTLILEFREKTVEIGPREVFIVPRGVEHLPRTKNKEEVWLMLFEPVSTKHTGELVTERTVSDQEWI